MADDNIPGWVVEDDRTGRILAFPPRRWEQPESTPSYYFNPETRFPIVSRLPVVDKITNIYGDIPGREVYSSNGSIVVYPPRRGEHPSSRSSRKLKRSRRNNRRVKRGKTRRHHRHK